jgi:hypothetical protein
MVINVYDYGHEESQWVDTQVTLGQYGGNFMKGFIGEIIG